MSGACSTCGFDGSSVSPSDAAVALRSFPRRYRSVLVRPADENEAEDPVRRRGAEGWSALEHAAWAAAAITEAGAALQQVLVRDDAGVTPPPVDPPSPPEGYGPGGTPAPEVLDQLTTATTSLASTIDSTSARQWGRTAAGGLSALDLARLGVHQGVHHLRLAERVLQEVVGRP